MEEKSIGCESGMSRIHVYKSTLAYTHGPTANGLHLEQKIKPQGWWMDEDTLQPHSLCGRLRPTHPLCKQEHCPFKTCDFSSRNNYAA